ncbi:sensor histidine kinase [Actinoplanes sp. NPDC051513]|uniref:sensor histidine kinase n=1 Tax=Actinoplanes sp. NPDC051513 TaxID=3363908 RepID=UPI0037A539AD
MSKQRWLTDGVIVALTLGLTLAILAARGFGTPGPTARSLDTQGFVLAFLTAAPLVVRRHRPEIAYGLSAVASLLLLHLNYPLDAPVATVVGAYALAQAYIGSELVPRTAALVAVNAFVPAVAVVYWSIGVSPRSIATELLAWATVFAGLWIAGDRSRLRLLRLTEAEERARRARAEAAEQALRALAEAEETARRALADAERDRKLAAADERTRIARELHDSAGHAINVILVQAGAARLLHDRDPERAKQALGTIESVARDTVTDIDRLVRALRDDREDVPADPGALDDLIERHRASGLAIAADLPEQRTPLPRSVAWAAYRILQEALTNAARHGAGSAAVAVRFARNRVEIDVTNPTADAGRHDAGRAGLGIVGMRERATLLGGTLTAEAEPVGIQPERAQPAGAAPARAQPAGAAPARAQPAGAAPARAQPAGAAPARAQPAGAAPARAQPAGAAPAEAAPAGAAPAGVQPAGVQPAGVQPAGVQPAGTKSGGTQPADHRFRLSAVLPHS